MNQLEKQHAIYRNNSLNGCHFNSANPLIIQSPFSFRTAEMDNLIKMHPVPLGGGFMSNYFITREKKVDELSSFVKKDTSLMKIVPKRARSTSLDSSVCDEEPAAKSSKPSNSGSQTSTSSSTVSNLGKHNNRARGIGSKGSYKCDCEARLDFFYLEHELFYGKMCKRHFNIYVATKEGFKDNETKVHRFKLRRERNTEFSILENLGKLKTKEDATKVLMLMTRSAFITRAPHNLLTESLRLETKVFDTINELSNPKIFR